MNQIAELAEKTRANAQAEFDGIVGLGSTIMLGDILKPMPANILPSSAFTDIRWDAPIPVGDLSVMRAVPLLDRSGTLTGWRLRVQWAVPWWDDSDTKDHHHFEVDRHYFGFGGSSNTFLGILTEFNTAVMLCGLSTPEDDEQEIVDNYLRWVEHRKKSAARFAELDARVLEFEQMAMQSEDHG